MLFNNSYYKGLLAEFYARLFLKIHGFNIIQKRYKFNKNTYRSEIDIIAKKGNLLLFIEVKQRRKFLYGINSLSNNQIKRLRLAAETYIIQNNWKEETRFDLIIVNYFKIYWIKHFI